MRTRNLIILFFSLLTSFSFSQTIFDIPNLSTVKVSSLSDADIQKIKDEMQKRNIAISDLESVAIAKGMSSADFAILKQRMEGMNTSSQNNPVVNTSNTPIEVAPIVPPEIITPPQTKLENSNIFGSEIFSNPALSFEPNLNLATPANYILGAMDELQIVIYGVQQYSEKVRINKEGKITLSNMGQLHLAGQTFAAAEMLIRKSASKIYSTLRSGESELSITLTNIRTINVTIIGAKNPGNYSLSSLSTVFNALHVAGGPNNNGSYRKIELVRGNKIIRVIDIYRFLMTGDQTDNVNLQDNDILRIPVYEKRVQINGSVKQSGIFELNENETFADLLRYCSGFSESAFKSSVKLTQNTDKELKIIDLPKQQYATYIPSSGDIFKVSDLLTTYENRVTIKGAVNRPDEYALREGMTIKDLIESADGLTEDAYLDHALLVREKKDLIKEIISIDLNTIMAGNIASNLLLNKEDELVISSKFDFLEKYTVSVNGEVQNPGEYPYIENLSLYDLIIRAGGVKESASKKIEIARMIKGDSVKEGSTIASEIIKIEFSGNTREKAKNILLKPYDIVQVRKMPVYEKAMPVFITGEVIYPGEYVISKNDERILDIIERAGGLSEEADENGVKIIRNLDNISTVKQENNQATIPIDYGSIKKHPKSRKNIRVQVGDQLFISKKNGVVKIVGQVALNSEIPKKGNKGVRYYISAVGGFSDSARSKKVYVVYANGMAKRTKNYVLFKIYPKVAAGSQIVVPKKTIAVGGLSTSEILGVSGLISSICGMVIIIARTSTFK